MSRNVYQAIGATEEITRRLLQHARTELRLGDFILVLPNSKECPCIKKQIIEAGQTLKSAYARCDPLYHSLPSMLPPEGLIPCVHDIFSSPAPYSFVAVLREYEDCLRRYVAASEANGENGAGRMEIAPGIIAPSAREDACIRGHLYQRSGVTLREAYSLCECPHIYVMPGGMDGCVTQALWKTEESMYGILQTCYNRYLLTENGNGNGNGEHPTPPKPPPKATSSLVYLGIGALALLALTGRKR